MARPLRSLASLLGWGIPMGLILVLFVVFFFTPAIASLVAAARVRNLGRRLEDMERRQFRLSERLSKLEKPGPAPIAKVEAPAGLSILEVSAEPVAPKPEPVAKAPAPPPRPVFIRTSPPPAAPAPTKEEVPLENLIGERILPRLGVVAIVLGLGLLVWYSYTNLGP